MCQLGNDLGVGCLASNSFGVPIIWSLGHCSFFFSFYSRVSHLVFSFSFTCCLCLDMGSGMRIGFKCLAPQTQVLGSRLRKSSNLILRKSCLPVKVTQVFGHLMMWSSILQVSTLLLSWPTRPSRGSGFSTECRVSTGSWSPARKVGLYTLQENKSRFTRSFFGPGSDFPYTISSVIFLSIIKSFRFNLHRAINELGSGQNLDIQTRIGP